jgi:hypothetical protein
MRGNKVILVILCRIVRAYVIGVLIDVTQGEIQVESWEEAVVDA